MNLTTATPVEIDTKLYEFYLEAARAEDKHNLALVLIHRSVGDDNTSWKKKAYSLTHAEAIAKATEVAGSNNDFLGAARKALEALAAAEAQAKAAQAAAEPLNAEFDRRGGWTRAFLVNNTNGHVHRSMNCSTCFPTTSYVWMVEYSGKDESEIVEAAGERACTVCYPSAPVDVLARPTQMFTPDEVEAAKARTERAEAKVAREAKKLAKAITPDGSALRVKVNGYTERFSTEVAARNWLVGHLADNQAYGYLLDPAAVQTVLKALAAKHGVTVDEERKAIDAKVAAKVKRG